IYPILTSFGSIPTRLKKPCKCASPQELGFFWEHSMSTGTGTSLKRSAVTSPASAVDAGKVKQAQQPAAKKEAAAEDARFANISANVFYKVMFDSETKPEEKRVAMARILTYEGTKEENREKIKAFELF